MAEIPDLQPGSEVTLWSAQGAAPVIAACNKFLHLQVDPPLRLDKSGEVWRISLDGQPGDDIPPSGQGGGFSNTDQSYTAYCPTGTSGGPLTVTVTAGTITSTVSQADADGLALELATFQAMAEIVCSAGGGSNSGINDACFAAGGQIWVGGPFYAINGYDRPGLCLFNSDLTINPAAPKLDNYSGQIINRIVPNGSDGVYAAGNFTQADFYTVPGLVSAYPNGAIDNSGFFTIGMTFGYGGGPGNCWQLCPTHLGTGYVAIAGTFDHLDGVARNGMAILDTGANDTGFDLADIAQPSSIYYDGGGHYYVGSNNYTGGAAHVGSLMRVGTTGVTDTSFQCAAATPSIPGPPNCVIVAFFAVWVGNAGITGGIGSLGLAKLGGGGAQDATFNTNSGTGPDGDVLTIAVQGTSLIIGGMFANYNGHTAGLICRIDSVGHYDATFVAQITGTKVTKILVNADNTLIVVGYFSGVNGHAVQNITKLDANGNWLA